MTIQLDMNLPEKWGMSYIGEDGQKHVPIMLHRAILGSIERFIGVYLERCGGKLPVWLSPVQVQILPVSDRHQKVAFEIQQKLMENDIRAEVDNSGNTISYQIRNAVKKKVPYIIVLGDKEIENNSISIRLRDGQQINDIPLSDFIERISEKIKSKSLDL